MCNKINKEIKTTSNYSFVHENADGGIAKKTWFIYSPINMTTIA